MSQHPPVTEEMVAELQRVIYGYGHQPDHVPRLCRRALEAAQAVAPPKASDDHIEDTVVFDLNAELAPWLAVGEEVLHDLAIDAAMGESSPAAPATPSTEMNMSTPERGIPFLPSNVERFGSPFPRRNCMDQWTPEEAAIWKVHAMVEAMPASVHLTDAVILLAQAAGKVADYLEGKPESSPSGASGTPAQQFAEIMRGVSAAVCAHGHHHGHPEACAECMKSNAFDPLTVLAFAEGVVREAIETDEGMDGAAGQELLAMIRNAKARAGASGTEEGQKS